MVCILLRMTRVGHNRVGFRVARSGVVPVHVLSSSGITRLKDEVYLILVPTCYSRPRPLREMLLNTTPENIIPLCTELTRIKSTSKRNFEGGEGTKGNVEGNEMAKQ